MAISKKNLALGSLITASIGTAATYPFAEGNLFLNIVHHGLLAATVGGLADWFGITALFHEPLGISYHTNVLINNRKRIEQDLSVFICDDLLSVDNILESINHIPLAQLIIDYFNSEPGKRALDQTIKPLISGFLDKADLSGLKNIAAKDLPHAIEGLNLPKYILDIASQIIRKDYLNPSIDLVLITLKDYTAHDENLKGIVADLLDQASRKYTEDMLLRQIFAKLSVTEITEQLLSAAKNYLQELRNPEHELRQKLKEILLEKVKELYDNEAFFQMVNGYVAEMASKKLSSMDNIIIKKDAAPIHAFLGQKLSQFEENEEYRAKLDNFLRDIIKKILNTKHAAITGLVEEKLASYSDEELVATIEGRVGDDLQMIRLNGTIVGGLSGVILSIITILAERMWS